MVVIDIKCIIYVLIPNCKPYINTRATPPNAPREVQFAFFLDTTGYDSRGGAHT